MLVENDKVGAVTRASVALVVAATALVATGTVAARTHRVARRIVEPAAWLAPVLTHPATVHAPREARLQPHTRPRATVSLYEHTTSPAVLRAQGCSAAKRGVGGIVILDFGQPAYDGHTYGTYLFSGRFAGNKRITQAMYGYAVGYHQCLRRGSALAITLARGTSNYHPQVPSAYKAGRKWARETMRLQHRLSAHPALGRHVDSAAADDVEPAWDRSFHRTRDFFRGYRDARTGHTIYNFGSLDGGVGGIWSARQAFFVASGMKYAQVDPRDLQPRDGARVGGARAHRSASLPPARSIRRGHDDAHVGKSRHEAARRAQDARARAREPHRCERCGRTGDAHEHPLG